MFVVDAYHGGDSGLVVLIVLWKIHLWTIIHSEWGGDCKDGVCIWEGIELGVVALPVYLLCNDYRKIR